MIDMILKEESEAIELDRENLRQFNKEIKNVFYGNLDDWHSEFIDTFCKKYHRELTFVEDAVIRETFQFLKTKI